MRMPLSGHIYHSKTDAELRYIVRDAGEAARAMQKACHERTCPNEPREDAHWHEDGDDTELFMGGY